MATFTITYNIPDDKLNGLRRDFCKGAGYQEQIEDPENPGQLIDNPEGKNAFIRRKHKEYFRGVAKSVRANEAAEAARLAASADMDENDDFDVE